VNLFDLILVAVVVLAAVGGLRLGFLARGLSWIGLGAGLYLAALFLPRLLRHLDLSTSGLRLVVAVLILIGAALAGQAVGLVIGSRLHRSLPPGPLRQADRAVGALVGAFGVLVILWLLLPSIASVPGWPARATRGSVISRFVSDHAPEPPNAVETLRREVGADNLPEVFATLHQGEDTGPPPAANPLDASVTALVAASTVKVEGEACQDIQDGSGFAVGSDLVATNAHVVAGEPAGDTDVIVPSGQHLPATVVAFDSNRDLALLSVPGLDERPLPLATGVVGDKGAVFGHPNGQAALAVLPAAIAQEINAVGRDLYDTHTTERDVFVLAADLVPGDSGSALVNTSGSVVGVAFATAPDRPGTSYALTTVELRAVLAEPHTAAVSTSSCLSD
jgi:S1-C subfamily serine protease